MFAVFALGVGHMAYRTYGPATMPKYYVSSGGKALIGPHSDGKQGKFAYFRRTLHLSQRPRQAWLEVVGRDQIAVYVNGQLVGMAGPIHLWAPAGLLVDITPYLVQGRNAIAVAARQNMALRPPAVSIRGSYTLDTLKYEFEADETWRSCHAFARGKTWWFATDYDDRNWERPKVIAADLQAHVYVPPRAFKAERTARWVTPIVRIGNASVMRREFNLPARPQSAWMRVSSTGAYRLAVNGIWVDAQEGSLGLTRATAPVQRIYDITPAVRKGHNAIAIQCITTSEVHMLADVEVEDEQGRLFDLSTDHDWVSLQRPSRSWHKTYVDDREAWSGCHVETSDMGLNPTLFEREVVTIQWPESLAARQMVAEALLICFVGVFTFYASKYALAWAGRRVPGLPHRAEALLYLSLLPASALIGAAVLATYDPRFAQQDIYRPLWLWLAVLSVPLQWLLLYSRATRTWPARLHWPALPRRVTAPLVIMLVLAVVGTWLRVRHLTVEPIHHDEVSAYWFTLGILEGGFPGGQPHKDIPYGYSATGELTYFPGALVALVIDDPVLILRIPALVFSIGTILLLYFVGARVWGPWVGVVAAALYTFAPYCIEMANFGRYFAQLQFFTVLTSYFFWRTLRGTGPIDHRALWFTGLSFLAMYFSWEGSGFLALGMVAAALFDRRGNLKTIIVNPMVWLAMLVMVLAFLVQDSHRVMQQTQRLWWGMGISDLELFPMWRYPTYFPSFYFVQLSWSADAFVPLTLLVCAILLAIRHAWQRPLRVYLIMFAVTTGAMTAVLPLRAGRYTYHLLPLAILTAAVVLVALARRVYRAGAFAQAPTWIRSYSGAVAAFVVVVFMVPATGITLQLTELYANPSLAYRVGELKFPHWEEPIRYVRKHMDEDDVVIATFPHLVDHTMYFAKDHPVNRGWTTDYWLQSTLILQATLDDVRSTPLDRRAGTKMIPSLDALRDVFARNKRVWMLVSSGPNNGLNDRDVSQYLRENMEVVYEDFLTTVMVRDANHRPVKLRQRDDVNLRYGKANYLP